MALSSDDFPELGKPTWWHIEYKDHFITSTVVKKPMKYIFYFKHRQLVLTSPACAMVRNSNWRFLSWPSVPGVAVIGARFSLERKNRFPFPPVPPNTARYSCPCLQRSTIVLPCSLITVPKGTFTNGKKNINRFDCKSEKEKCFRLNVISNQMHWLTEMKVGLPFRP